MPRQRFLIPWTLVVLVAVAWHSARGENVTGSEEIVFFEKKVRPILVDHCYTCHSADTKPSGGLRVDDRNGLLTGGATGPAVVPGEPAKSLLLLRVTHKDAETADAAGGPAADREQVADLTTWIKDGAAWPDTACARVARQAEAGVREAQEGTLGLAAADRSEGAGRPGHGLAAGRHRSLHPRPARSRGTRAGRRRRQGDSDPPRDVRPDRPAADARGDRRLPQGRLRRTPSSSVVDRLLASPQFGERWGRHWLDVARYAESTGPSRNIPYPHAWRYRDYVIDAFNADMPFDHFVREQIAGDLLPAALGARSATGC